MDKSADILLNRLSNGLTAICMRQQAHAAYSGVLVGAGSRDDGPRHDGLAHFVEHCIFKGTTSRKAYHIAGRMEVVGGELNAFTNKEEIMLHTLAPVGFEERGIELLHDLVANATFPETEVNREKTVILEEINSYETNPSMGIYDRFDELMFANHEMAHNILGYSDSLADLTPDDARNFVNRYFTPANMVVFCMSPTDPSKTMRLIEKHFNSLRRDFVKPVRTPAECTPRFDINELKADCQGNVIIGSPIPGMYDQRKFAFLLLSNYLGSYAANSRLNMELREKRGLVYDVNCSVALYQDIGTFQVNFGTDPSNVEKCTRIIRNEIEKVADGKVSPTAFTQMVRQCCGQNMVMEDRLEGCAMRLARRYMRYGELQDVNYDNEILRSITADQLRDAARLILDNDFSRLIM